MLTYQHLDESRTMHSECVQQMHYHLHPLCVYKCTVQILLNSVGAFGYYFVFVAIVSGLGVGVHCALLRSQNIHLRETESDVYSLPFPA